MGSIVTKHRNTRPQPPPSPPSTLRWVLARAHMLQWPSSSLRFWLAQAPPPYVNLWRPNHLVSIFPSPLLYLCMEIGSYDSSPPSPVLTGISSFLLPPTVPPPLHSNLCMSPPTILMGPLSLLPTCWLRYLLTPSGNRSPSSSLLGLLLQQTALLAFPV